MSAERIDRLRAIVHDEHATDIARQLARYELAQHSLS